MAPDKPVTDIFLGVISVIIAVLIAVPVQNLTNRYGVAILFLIVLFFLLYACAALRGWKLPGVVPFVRSSQLSEVFLGLALTVTALAISWYIGLAISRAFSDMEGILAGLVIFGAAMLVISAARNWQ